MNADREPPPPKVSLVILNWNTRDLLAACLASVEAVRDELPLQVIVVDNASTDGSADMVAERFGWTTLVRNERNDGYAIGNNIGAERATGEYLFLLNSDTEVRPGALTELADFLDAHPGHGACAPLLEHPDGSIQRSCMTFPTRRVAVYFDTCFDRWFPKNRTIHRYFMRDFDHESSRDVEQPPAAAFMVRRALWEELEGFDPELWLFFNDVDLCLRMSRAGWRIAYVAEARILHHEGCSTRQFPEFGVMWHKNRCAYYRKHFGWSGTLLARIMSTVRAHEEWRRLRREQVPRSAQRRVWTAVREIWSA